MNTTREVRSSMQELSVADASQADAVVRVASDQPDWCEQVTAAVRYTGVAIVEGVLDQTFLERLKAEMYDVRRQIREIVGEDRLRQAGELGVLRLMCAYAPTPLELLQVPEVLAVVDATVGPTAIMHLQNGFILPSFAEGEVPETFQNSFHKDFPRHLDGFLASVNTLFAIDDFTDRNGGTLVVPATHQQAPRPHQAYLDACAVPVRCPAGSMLVFDSTLWHAAGANVSGADRVGVNQQFTRPWIKQQVDYVRALGDDAVLKLPARSQQLLGYYTRVVTSLQEYYLPPDERLYRSGQG